MNRCRSTFDRKDQTTRINDLKTLYGINKLQSHQYDHFMSLQRRNNGSNTPRPSPQRNEGVPTPGPTPSPNTIPSPGIDNSSQLPQPQYDTSQGNQNTQYDPGYRGVSNSNSQQYNNNLSYGNQAMGERNSYERTPQNGAPSPSLPNGIPNQPIIGNQGPINTGSYGGNGNTFQPNTRAYNSSPQQMNQTDPYGASIPPQGNQDLSSVPMQNVGFDNPNVSDGSYNVMPDLDDYDVDDNADYDVSFDPIDSSSDSRSDYNTSRKNSDLSNAEEDHNDYQDSDDDEEFTDEEVHKYLTPMRKKQEKLSKEAKEKRQDENTQEERRSRKSKLNGRKAQDRKKNNAQTAKTVRIAVIIGIVIVIIIGLYQCLMPKHEWTADEISNVSRQANGDTGFPMQQGAGIAQQFIEAYLQSTDDSSKKILSVFYNGVDFSKANDSEGADGATNMQTPSNVRQVIKAGPYLYEELATGPNGDAASYKFGALVYRVDIQSNKPIVGKDGKTPDFKWLFYQVDVHYDKNTNKFVISKNSPTRVPEPKTQSSSSIPQYALPGDGQEVEGLDEQSMQNLITTFFKAWAKSDDASMVNITDGSSLPSVHEGLDDQVVIDGNGDPSFKIYGPPSTDPYYRALVTVNWRENIGNQGDGYVQTSMYVLKLKKQGNKFIVVDVQPYKYIPYVDPDSDSGEDSSNDSSNEE